MHTCMFIFTYINMHAHIYGNTHSAKFVVHCAVNLHTGISIIILLVFERCFPEPYGPIVISVEY